jgi:[acyl-carrier-protein] S-malonyltransferase
MTTGDRTAMVFPGMGPVEYADSARFMMINPVARRLFAAADRALGWRVADRYRDSEAHYSVAAQVAFLVNCLALAEWARDTLGIEPGFCAGPSFGLKAATAFSGALPFEETVRMTAALARCTEDYFATEHTDVVTCSFVRTPEPELRKILDGLDERGQWYDIACHLDHDFFMVSLKEPELDRFQRDVRATGGLPLYTMRPPMHSAVFDGLRRRAEDEVLGDLPFADPAITVIADQDGAPVDSGDGVRRLLLDGFVRPVRWPEVVRSLRERGVGTVCVAGQDSLFGRVGCTVENFTVVPVNPRVALRPRQAVS